MKSTVLLAVRTVCAAIYIALAPVASAQSLEEIKSLFKRSEIYPMGTVYFEADDGERYAIPFATISVYDYDDNDKLAYLAMADRFGTYIIPNYEYKKSFIFNVDAPGFRQGSFKVNPLSTTHPDGRPLRGNTVSHFELTKISEGGSPYSLKIYKVDDLKRKTDAGDLMELIGSIPGLRYEDGDITTADGGAVRLLATDGELPSGVLKYLRHMPFAAFTEIEVYTLPEGGLFDAVVNILGVVGKRKQQFFSDFKVWGAP